MRSRFPSSQRNTSVTPILISYADDKGLQKRLDLVLVKLQNIDQIPFITFGKYSNSVPLNINIYINDINIEWLKSYRYLEAWMDQHMRCLH